MSLKLKDLADFSMGRVVKKKGMKIEEKIPQVIANTYRKNVHFSPLHDIHENK
jgi:hypothetical protein